VSRTKNSFYVDNNLNNDNSFFREKFGHDMLTNRKYGKSRLVTVWAPKPFVHTLCCNYLKIKNVTVCLKNINWRETRKFFISSCMSLPYKKYSLWHFLRQTFIYIRLQTWQLFVAVFWLPYGPRCIGGISVSAVYSYTVLKETFLKGQYHEISANFFMNQPHMYPLVIP
jgi:hypothetical protein